MKKQFQFENYIVDGVLTDSEHLRWRAKLKRLSNSTGIESICLSKEELFIEYNPQYKASDNILEDLRILEFPLKTPELVELI